MKFSSLFRPFLFASLATSLSIAGNAEVVPNDSIIPKNKNLPKQWEASLFQRGKQEVVTSQKGLMHIGMPVGGLFCGTVYLGGDGKLWLWDIFNDNREGIIPKIVDLGDGRTARCRDGAIYIEPEDTQPSIFVRGFPISPEMQQQVAASAPGGAPRSGSKNNDILAAADQFQQGFAIKVGDQVRPLTIKGWKNVSFTGTYPIGTVAYKDPASPVSVSLEAFSPFIPLNTKDSSLPTTIMSYTITNTSKEAVTGSIGGWLENGVCANSGYTNAAGGNRINKAGQDGSSVFMMADGKKVVITNARENIVFEDFEKNDYDGWTVQGTAFSNSPLESSRIPPYMGDIGMQGGKAAVSHNVRDGGSITDGDTYKGSLLSKEFTIDRNYINFMIAGGNRPQETGLRLLIDDKVVRTATGHNGNKLRNDHFDVKEFQGKKARLLIEDQSSEAWGNIIIDNIVFSDVPDKTARPVEEEADFGSLCLSVANPEGKVRTIVNIPRTYTEDGLFRNEGTETEFKAAFGEPSPLSGVVQDFSIPAGKSVTVTFVISWYFPNIYLGTIGDSGRPGPDGKKGGRHYSVDFKDATEVASYVKTNLKRLTKETRLWRDTWYDSSLPYWFLDRTFANTSILATTTSHRFTNGRFYSWEGVGACGGTCTHVWQYAQAPARLFPDIERYTREHIDLGIGFTPDIGQIAMRGEHHMGPAVDGQCGRIMGIWREHTMSADDSFLKRVWPNAKKAVEFVLNHDTNQDGIMDGPQENTLDAAWFGEIAWTSIESLGALKAGEEMALVMGDQDFANTCRERRLTGQKNVETKLFNGKWFYQIPLPEKKNTFGTYNGSFIDQLFGQSMAYQCGLGTLVSPKLQKTALQSIWTNNFALDLGPYLEKIRPLGRPYYVPGEGGTLMCTNALNEENPYGGGSWTHGYLNECMTGFEHQYASHLMYAGLVKESLAATRVIHDRYNAEKRNPYNEIECSDHYSRAMASYGTYVSACGYQYNGPKGELTFNPKMNPAKFQAAFTTAEGWGTYSQEKTTQKDTASIGIRYGKLVLHTLNLPSLTAHAGKITAQLDGNPVELSVKNGAIIFKQPVTIEANQVLTVTM